MIAPEAEWQARKAREEAARPFVTILHPGGVLHSNDCAVVREMMPTAEQVREFNEWADENDRAHRRAWAEARNYVIG